MNKYLLSKIAFAFFSCTTVLFFISLYFGYSPRIFRDFVSLFGSIYVFFGVNTALLLISTVFYAWQRAHADLPRHQAADILSAYARSNDPDKKKTKADKR